MDNYWLLALLTYPLAGLAYYSICLLVLDDEKIRAIGSKHPAPVWAVISAAALMWPICMARAWRKIRDERG
jgi:hypothetical protein